MDIVEQRHRFGRLVRLQLADHMQFDVRIVCLEGRPFVHRFLDPVFPEHPMTCLQQGPDLVAAAGFGHGDKRDGGWLAVRYPGGLRHLARDLFQCLVCQVCLSLSHSLSRRLRL